MENVDVAKINATTGPGGIPIPVQAPLKDRPTFPEAPAKEKDFLMSAVKDGPRWWLNFKTEIDAKASGPMLLQWIDGRVIGKYAEPALFDLQAKIRQAEKDHADHQAALENRQAALKVAEEKRQFSVIESTSARIRELGHLTANAEAILADLRTTSGPARLISSINEKKQFADQLRDELARVDAEIDAARELHSAMTSTAKPAAKAK
jgi:hypothetical protein